MSVGCARNRSHRRTYRDERRALYFVRFRVWALGILGYHPPSNTAYKAVLKSLPHARDERTGLGTRELSGRDEESPFATVIYFFAMNSNLSGLPVV